MENNLFIPFEDKEYDFPETPFSKAYTRVIKNLQQVDNYEVIDDFCAFHWKEPIKYTQVKTPIYSNFIDTPRVDIEDFKSYNGENMKAYYAIGYKTGYDTYVFKASVNGKIYNGVFKSEGDPFKLAASQFLEHSQKFNSIEKFLR